MSPSRGGGLKFTTNSPLPGEGGGQGGLLRRAHLLNLLYWSTTFCTNALGAGDIYIGPPQRPELLTPVPGLR